MVIKKVTIFGERCSGTNYLEELLRVNFEVEIVWSHGWKHYFGFHDVTQNSDEILFIGIIRNLEDWVNSLYREKHALPWAVTKDVETFLTGEFFSVDEAQNEVMVDRNIETKERYKNIFELRHVKNKYLVETMPKLVKNYCLITYDDLVNHFDFIMGHIKNYNLEIKKDISFPSNVKYYKMHKDVVYVKKPNQIPKEKILAKANMHYEKMLFHEFL